MGKGSTTAEGVSFLEAPARGERRINAIRRLCVRLRHVNQYDRQIQTYRGVERVLIARLIVESVLQGGHGRVLVKPRIRVQPFYRKLGFTGQQEFRLTALQAEAVLKSTLLPQAEEETA